LLWWLAYIALGLFTGFFAGMLGIGGGLVMVPTLTMMFAAQAGFPPGEVLHLALGTSMAAILFTSLASLLTHHRHGAVLWKIVVQITPGILVGTRCSARCSPPTSRPTAGRVLHGFRLPGGGADDPQPEAESVARVAGCGRRFSRRYRHRCGVGTGRHRRGSLTVPFLTWCNVRVQHAIGTSAAVGFPIAVGGSLGYIFNGWGHPGLPQWSLGYVFLPAFIWLVPSSMLTAPLGARLAHRLPVATLKRLFAGVLIVLAAKMLWGLVRLMQAISGR
jgi:uncharacterized membrane protein YfcA